MQMEKVTEGEQEKRDKFPDERSEKRKENESVIQVWYSRREFLR